MSEYSLRLAKPHCDACHQPKVEVERNLDGSVAYGPERYHPGPFPENRKLKQGEIVGQQSLAERIKQTIHKAQKQEEEL